MERSPPSAQRGLRELAASPPDDENGFMNDRSEPIGSVAALVVAILLAIAIVGGGLYFYFTRHFTAIQAREAMAAEARARAEAERARAAQAILKSAQAKAATLQEGAAPADVQGEILAVLDAQRALWNAGDIAGFMEHYWKSDELTFSSGGTTTRGWQATLDRYKSKYPTAEKMGALEFSELEVFPQATTSALVLGKWRLAREPDPVGGNFSIVFRKIEGRWLIVHDHTSVLATEEKPNESSETPPGSDEASGAEASETPVNDQTTNSSPAPSS
jgi:beta-aspartyl-peptidase (threonine type)